MKIPKWKKTGLDNQKIAMNLIRISIPIRYTMTRTSILFLILFLLACNQNKNLDENPATVEGKRELLEKKKEELKSLEKQIAELTDDIVKNDPSLEKKKKIVTSMPVSRSTFYKYIDLEGVVIADKTANAVSESPGRIIYLAVKEGDYVRKGALIARLDLDSYNKQKDEILTSMELATDIYERQSRLWAQNIGSEVQYLQAKNNVERLEKSLDLVNHQLTKAKVYAPISGVVDKEITKQGEFASPGMPIVRILNVKDVKVQVDLPERYLAVVKKGLKVEMYFPSIDKTSKGRVSLLGRSIDPANRTLRFEVNVSNSSGLLKPNLLAELRVAVRKEEDVFSLPLELVQQDVDGNDFVMKVAYQGDEHMAKKVSVKVSDVYDNQALIEEGVNDGDILVNDGARLVSDGEGIIISEAKKIEDE